jgi:hypothetical protein
MNKNKKKIVVEGHIYNHLNALRIIANEYEELPLHIREEITKKQFDSTKGCKITPKLFKLYTSNSISDNDLALEIGKTKEYRGSIKKINLLIKNREYEWSIGH